MDRIDSESEEGATLQLIRLQAQILRAVATNQAVLPTLALLCEETTVAFPDCTPAILVLDSSRTGLRVAAGDRLSAAAVELLESLPLRRTAVGSREMETVVVDLAPSSEVWEQLGRRPAKLTFQANWSTTLLSEAGETLGVLILFWHGKPLPDSDDLATLHSLADLVVSVLIRHDRQQHRLSLITAERVRIAGELHDDSIQAIIACSLHLQQLRTSVEQPELQHEVGRLLDMTNGVIDSLRGVLFDLHPITLEEDGLLVTLKIYLEDMVKPAGVEWEVLGDETGRAPAHVEGLGLRLACEAINGALEHAHPSNIAVSVLFNPNSLLVTVRDDGRGFDVAQVAVESGHDGIQVGRVLAESIGGTYEVQSSLDEGTSVRISLPIMFRDLATSSNPASLTVLNRH